MFKSTMLLATGLFLIFAPAPDAGVIAEMTHNLIILERADGTILADELEARKTGYATESEMVEYREERPSNDETPEPAI